MQDDNNFTASRQSSDDSSSFSALSSNYEERKIILAQGKQFQNADLGDYAIPTYLSSRLSNLVVTDDRNMTYADDVQHVNFTIQRVTTKSDFMQALQTDGAHVVYCGHSRFGQGPCFGDSEDPGEEWGAHSNSLDTGIFRSGFPYVGIPVEEIGVEHQYTVSPVDGSQPLPAASDCHPHAASVLSQMTQMQVSDFLQEVSTSSDSLSALLGNAGPDDTFWGYHTRGEDGKDNELHVLLSCGWQNSGGGGTDASGNVDVADLGDVNLSCKAFICIACSTFVHFYPVVRKFLGWKKSGDSNYAYWTTNATASGCMTAFWLYRILSYPQRNDNQPWEPSLEYAKQMANQDYAALSQGYTSLI